MKQILTQVVKQQKRNNMKNNKNNYNSNTHNENNFTNENDSPMFRKKLSLIILLCKGQLGEKVIKSLMTVLYKSLPNNIEAKVMCNGTKLVSNFQINGTLI